MAHPQLIIIVTTDPNITRCVFVKNFEEFEDMVDNPRYDDSMKTIDLAQGEEWRFLRKIMSPTFTSGKLKSMVEPITDVTNKTMKYLVKAGHDAFQGFQVTSWIESMFFIKIIYKNYKNDNLWDK